MCLIILNDSLDIILTLNFCIVTFNEYYRFITGQGHFYFRVKFYVSDPSKLQEEYTRYHFYLQVRKDILQGRLIIPPSTACLLASYVIQCKYLIYFIFCYVYYKLVKVQFIYSINCWFSNDKIEIR